jgi:5-methylcytosine-specific restriction enzyme A
MPTAARRPCSTPGCAAFARPRQSRCPECAHAAAIRKGTRQARGYDGRWLRFRMRYLRRHPTCAWPGCANPATDVDHIDGQGPTGPYGYDEGNLRPYCHGHHAARTARDQPGGWNQPR